MQKLFTVAPLHTDEWSNTENIFEFENLYRYNVNVNRKFWFSLKGIFTKDFKRRGHEFESHCGQTKIFWKKNSTVGILIYSYFESLGGLFWDIDFPGPV